MVKPEVLRRRLEKLDEYLAFLERVKDYPRQKFLDESEIWASAERFLQMAIESINDIANHIIADESLGSVDQYRDLSEIFAKEGFIDDVLKQKWIRMIGFRNILVHGYAKIDRSEVYDIIQHNLDDINELRKVFAEFL
jgi:uncharacterized protein YutE (UPF0331/DUF86 family)